MSDQEHREIIVNVELKVKVRFTEEIYQITQADDWQQSFYHIPSPYVLAEMFAHNAVANNVDDMTRLDGFYGLDKDAISVEKSDYYYEEDI